MVKQTNQIERIQRFLERVYNPMVLAEFADDEEAKDLKTTRGILKEICSIDDDDPLALMGFKFLIFFVLCRKAADFLPPIYGIPEDLLFPKIKYEPQVRLYFRQRTREAAPGYSPISGEIKFRLHNITPESLTEGRIRQLAATIKQHFVEGKNGHLWTKGNVNYTYWSDNPFYRLSILASSEGEAREIINRVLAIQHHKPNYEECFTVHDPKKPSQNSARKTRRILGKTRKEPRYRPTGTVRFRYAELYVHSSMEPITLVDLTHLRSALIRV